MTANDPAPSSMRRVASRKAPAYKRRETFFESE